MTNIPLKQPLILRELVFNGYPSPMLDILNALASHQLRTFVCFGLSSGNGADYNEVVQTIINACPNLTTLDFPKLDYN